MTQPQPLAGRTALVTGAGNPDGIGFACAQALAALGATVHVTSTTERIHDRAADLGAGSVGVVADLTVEADVAVLHDAVGDLDVLANNAGMLSVGSPDVLAAVVAMSYDDWRADLARNLDTAFLVTRQFLPAMVAAGWGRVVNVASTTGPVNAMPDESAYAAAKAAVVAFLASPASSDVTGRCLVVDGGNSVLEAR